MKSPPMPFLFFLDLVGCGKEEEKKIVLVRGR
jgi:hypothetical protein